MFELAAGAIVVVCVLTLRETFDEQLLLLSDDSEVSHMSVNSLTQKTKGLWHPVYLRVLALVKILEAANSKLRTQIQRREIKRPVVLGQNTRLANDGNIEFSINRPLLRAVMHPPAVLECDLPSSEWTFGNYRFNRHRKNSWDSGVFSVMHGPGRFVSYHVSFHEKHQGTTYVDWFRHQRGEGLGAFLFTGGWNVTMRITNLGMYQPWTWWSVSHSNRLVNGDIGYSLTFGPMQWIDLRNIHHNSSFVIDLVSPWDNTNTLQSFE